MAHVLSPLSETQQNQQTPSTITRSSTYKTSHSTYSKSYSLECEGENRFESSDMEFQSSPFPADDLLHNYKDQQRSRSTSPTKHSSSPRKASSPHKRSPSKETTIQMDSERVSEEHVAKDSQESLPGDDTCLSTFSAIPNADMTHIASLTQSPSKSRSSSPQKRSPAKHREPRQSRPTTPGTVRSNSYDLYDHPPSPTPRVTTAYSHDGSDDTTNLLDFTAQLDTLSQTPSQSRSRPSPSKTHTQPNFLAIRSRSPEKQNLLDFDIPPAQTPRSVPAITVRDYEALKATLNSQISTLKATLEGRETEIKSLKAMKESAEARMGEVLEEIRDCRDAKAVLTVENKDVEKRASEMRDRARRLESERASWQQEKADMAQRVADLEIRAQQAEAKAPPQPSAPTAESPPDADPAHAAVPDKMYTEAEKDESVNLSITRVSRELHGLYREKHETKVTALKKSYAAKWERQIRDLTAQLEASRRECEDLRLQREATFSNIIPSATGSEEAVAQEEANKDEQARRLADFTQKLEAQDVRIRGLETRNQDLEGGLEHAREERNALRGDLERERVEMGALVATVDEMLAIQQMQPPPPPPELTPNPTPDLPAESFARPLSTSSSTTTKSTTRLSEPASPPPPSVSATSGLAPPSSHAKSGVAKLSGLKGPGFGLGQSRIGGLKGRAGSGEGAAGTMTGGMGLGVRSDIRSNIERMGRGRG